MTRNRSSRNRRRNRDQADNAGDQSTQVESSTIETPRAVAEETTPGSSQSQSSERRRRRPERSGPQAERRPAPSQERRPRSSSEGQPDQQPRSGPPPSDRRPRSVGEAHGEESRQGGQRQNRRRPGRRQQIPVPVVGDVFKPGLRITGGRNERVAVKPEISVDNDGVPVLGCPMLTRTRLGIPFAGGRHTPRCALGWAIHTEREAGYCMETPDVALCWKQNPERLEELKAIEDDRAAD